MKWIRREELTDDMFVLTDKAHMLKVADPNETCCKAMRGNSICLLDKGHKSKRHSSSVYECELCGKARPNPPYKTQTVIIHGEVDDIFQFCFLCAKDD